MEAVCGTSAAIGHLTSQATRSFAWSQGSMPCEKMYEGTKNALPGQQERDILSWRPLAM